MQLCAVFIIKDDSELPSFKNAVESVKNHIDTWYVVANGKETQGIEKFVKKHGGNYYYLAWNEDFSEQRNFIISKLPDDCDYYFWMDADDILIGGEYLKHTASLLHKKGLDVGFIEYWYGCSFSGKPSEDTLVKVDVKHFRERLINPKSHYWKGRLHETPMPTSGRKDSYTKISYSTIPIAIMHTKTVESAIATMERNQRILELQLEEEREKNEVDPRTLLYLMKIYAESTEKTQWTTCIEMGEEYLTKSGWDEERGTCCDLMAICYNKLGDNQKAIKLLHDAIREFPHYPLLYFRLAMAYHLIGKNKEARHWLEIGLQMPLDESTAGIRNIQEMKVLSAQVLLKLKFEVEKDYQGALAAAEILKVEQPSQENEEQYYRILDITDLENACKQTDNLFKYLLSIGEEKTILSLLDKLPHGMTSQPFAIKWRKKVTPPRIWKLREICIYASFNGPHFEKWDGNSLEKGIGGSETAVIKLAEEWHRQGYTVTIYGDPQQPNTINGIKYLPWYYFNKADYFNIFIQWRGSHLAQHIKCNKYLVDVHDLYDQNQLLNPAVDRYMLKSKYHHSIGKALPATIISNGIDT